LGYIESRLDVALRGEAFDVPPKSGRETNLVEQRGMRKMRNGTDLLADLIDHGNILVDHPG